ncbi:MFS transporter [Novosphingobium kaempferiae]|uniref:MFS transporter n=1 Tax=Novosphingobium kaempferiae TaxID=2896849 RepID=UPI001E5D7249|nr:MFS transporter [Novosphingobium kaempferiae]
MLDDRLNHKTRFAFGAGGIPETLKNSVWDMFILFYFTQVLHLPGSLAGVAIAIALTVNALVDPSIGSYSDAMPVTKLGRRQMLMAIASVPFAISFTLLFWAPPSFGPVATFAWLVGFSVIARVAISLFTIPYYALGVELSRNKFERPILTSFRSVGTSLGRMVMPIVAFTFFFAASPEFPNGQLNRAAYPKFALAISLVSLVLMAWCIWGTNARSKEIERRVIRTGAVRRVPSLAVTFGQIAHAFRSTRNVRWQVLLGVFMFISLGVLNVYTLHLCTYYWRLTPEDIRNVSAALPPGGLLAALVARYYVPYFEKKRLMLTCIVLYGLVVLVPIAGPLTPLFPQPGTPLQAPLLIGFKFMAGFFYGAFLTTSATVAGDVADELELNSGEPRQALLSSFTFFTMFAASAVVNIAAGIFLDLIAFPVGLPVAQVSVATSDKLAIFSCIVIAFAVSGVTYVVSRLEISAEKQRLINEQLEARYALAAQGASA